jgi:single-strand DNA-binding protein
MADLNKVFLMGRLTFDPELRRTPAGVAVADLRMATSRSWTGRDGERREETLFIDVTVWDRQAENCCQYLRKGSPIHVEGSLKMDTWSDKNTGEKRSKLSVNADRVQFLDSRRGDSNGGPDDEHTPNREPAGRRSGGAARGSVGGDSASPANGPGRATASSAESISSHGLDDGGEDDIPF